MRQLFADLLDTEWIEDADKVTGRVRDVPKPKILAEKAVKRHDLSRQPLIEVKDGGAATKEPKGLGWHEEQKVAQLQITIQLVDEHNGEVRMNGYRAGPDGDADHGLDPYEKESYGGLSGEVERILDQNRKGLAEYQLVEAFELDDVSDQMEYGRYRVDVNVRLHGEVTVIN